MEIKIEELVPNNWTIENVGNDQTKVYYINNGRGSSPKPFILPRIVKVDKEFVEAVAMYLGDGKLSADPTHLGFASIDYDMVKFMFDFFVQRFNITLNDFTISINCREFKDKILENWAKALNVPSSKFRIQTTLRSKNPSCDLQISGKIFREIFGKLIDKIILSDFLLNEEFRRAFLRGLFAAEGNVAVNTIQNYIVCVQFCLCYREEDLSNLIKKALELENITYNERKVEKDTSRTIVITNWKNYCKCWKINLFHLNLRKKHKFLSKLKVTKFSCNIDSQIMKKLLDTPYLSHREIAFLIGTTPPQFCQWVNNKTKLMNIEYLISLSKITSTPLEEVKNNIIEFRVNDVTPIDDKEFIDFIFDLKRFC